MIIFNVTLADVRTIIFFRASIRGLERYLDVSSSGVCFFAEASRYFVETEYSIILILPGIGLLAVESVDRTEV